MKNIGKIALVLAIIVGIAMVYFQYDQILRLIKLVTELSLGVLVLAVVFQIFTYIFQGYAFKYLLKIYKKRSRIIELTNAAVAYTFINQLLPAAGLTAAPIFTNLKEKKANKGESAVIAVAWFVLYYATFFFALFIGFIGLFFDQQYERGQATPFVFAVLLIFIVAIIGYYTVREKERLNKVLHFVFNVVLYKIPFIQERAHAWHDKIIGFVDELYHASAELKERKFQLIPPFFFTLLIHVMDFLTLLVLLNTFGADISLPVIIVGYCLANLVTMVSAVPLGIGVFEASMALTYSGLGVPFESALLAVLIFRALAFWVILPIGAFSYHHFMQDWGFGSRKKK